MERCLDEPQAEEKKVQSSLKCGNSMTRQEGDKLPVALLLAEKMEYFHMVQQPIKRGIAVEVQNG